MSSTGIEPTIPTIKRLPTNALDRITIGIGNEMLSTGEQNVCLNLILRNDMTCNIHRLLNALKHSSYCP